VALEVVHGNERLVVDPGERLGEVHADEQRAGEARAIGDGDPVDVPPFRAGLLPRRVEDRHDPAQVRPRRHLRHDAAGRGVKGDLRRDDVGVDAASVLDERDARLVARRLDREQEAHGAPSAAGGSGGSISGAVSTASRSRARRDRIRSESSVSVVMISASSRSSL
jgi:hypothetical protein